MAKSFLTSLQATDLFQYGAPALVPIRATQGYPVLRKIVGVTIGNQLNASTIMVFENEQGFGQPHQIMPNSFRAFNVTETSTITIKQSSNALDQGWVQVTVRDDFINPASGQ